VKTLKRAVVMLLLCTTTALIGGAASAAEAPSTSLPAVQTVSDAWCVQVFMGRIAQPVYCVPVII
jgi:hypothetical protein